MSTESTDLVDLNEALEILRTSRPTLYRWLRSGKIKGTKVGRQWRFRREDLDRFLRDESPAVQVPVSAEPLLETMRRLLQEVAPGANAPAGAEPAETIVSTQIVLAKALRASDLHLGALVTEAGQAHQGVLRFRVDGVLQHPIIFDLRLLAPIVQIWKQRAGCNIHETTRPQDGRILLELDDPLDPRSQTKLDLRVSFLSAGMGESVTVRLLDPTTVLLTLDRAKHHPHDRERLQQALAANDGLVICSGPAGSGKTTLMYMCLNELNQPDRKVMSIEDPVEFWLPWVTQVPIRSDQGLTFTKAARSMLRADPDVIMIGELRDLETAQIAVQATLTGHLVLTQLHAPTAASAITRLLDMGLDPFLITESLSLVVSQRLIRHLCPHCRQESTPTEVYLAYAQEAAESGGLAWADLSPTWCEPVGCEACGKTGYRGRGLISEVLPLTAAIKRAIRQQPTASELQRLAVAEGMTTMTADGVRRAAASATSLQEVMRVRPQANAADSI